MFPRGGPVHADGLMTTHVHCDQLKSARWWSMYRNATNFS